MSNRENKNHKSWNIPNDVRVSPNNRHVKANSAANKPARSENRKSGDESNSSVKTESTPVTPSRRVRSTDNYVSARQEMAQREINEESQENFQFHLWKLMFYNVERSIDELLDACDTEENDFRCYEAMQFLHTRMLEFNILGTRIQYQRGFSNGQYQAVAWEVPKRTTSTYSQHSMESKLRATAQAFQPASFNKDEDFANSKLPADEEPAPIPADRLNEVMSGNDTVSSTAPTPPITVAPIASYRERAMTESALTSTQKVKLSVTTTDLPPFRGKTKQSKVIATVPAAAKSSRSRSTSVSVKEPQHVPDWDDQTEQMMQEEREKVWRAAEKLVEDAAKEEDQQWLDNGLRSAHKSAKKSSNRLSMGPLELELDSLQSSNHGPAGGQSQPSGAMTGLFSVSGSLVSPPNYVRGQRSNGSSTAISVSGSMTPSGVPPKSPFSRTGSPYLQHSNSNTFLSPSSTTRSLHDKLSSPDRKKTTAPDEIKRRSEDRMKKATISRENQTAQKVEKAKVNSERVESSRKNNALKSAQLKEHIEGKQSQAGARRQDMLNTIKERAGNENTKVEEVQFINGLNSEGIADELHKKLMEAEVRALNAAERRQHILDNKSYQQQTKNNRKAQQISELKMEQERLKMVRFEALQAKLKAVEDRKQERIAEMRRRDDSHRIAATRSLDQENKSSSGINIATPSAPTASAASKQSASVSLDGSAAPSDDSPSQSRNIKAKARRQKKRAQQTVNSLTTPSAKNEEEDFSAASLTPHSELQRDADLGASLQSISEAYQSMFLSLTKKVLLASRLAFIEAAKCETVAAPGDASPRGGFQIPSVAQSDSSHMSGLLSQFMNTFSAMESARSGTHCGRYFVLARQLLFAQTPISSINSAVSSRNTHSIESVESSEMTSPTNSTERQVKFNIPLMLCTVDLASTQSVGQFVAEGGVLLLRILLGYEVGILSSDSTFNEVLNCPVDPTLGKSLGLIIFELVRMCAQNTEGLAQLYATGVPILLSDIATVLFSVQETLSKGSNHSKGTASTATSATTGSVGADSRGLGVQFPYCVNVLLPLVVSCLSVVVSPPEAEPIAVNGSGGFSLSPSAVDAFVWYVFSCNLFTALCDSLRADVQCLQYRHSYSYAYSSSSESSGSGSGSPEYRQYSTIEAQDSLICNSNLVAKIADRMRLSGRLTSTNEADHLVKSFTQLSPQVHSHPQGKKVISLLRRSEVVPLLISLAYSLITEYEHINIEAQSKAATAAVNSAVSKTRRGNAKPAALDATSAAASLSIANQLRVYSSLIEALHNLASTDISLVQSLTKDQQILLVNAFSYLIRSHVNSLDDGNTINVFAVQQTSSSHAGLFKTFLKSDAEESIKRLLTTLSLFCLRCSDLQRECSSITNLKPLFCPVIVSIQQQQQATVDAGKAKADSSAAPAVSSLLVTLCRLSNKFYKDRKFKQSLHPCLMAMSLDVDGNINIIRNEGKIGQVVKYLEFYIFEHNKYFNQKEDSSSSSGVGAAGKEDLAGETGEDANEKLRVSNIAMIVNFSRLLPFDSWNTALLTYN